MIARIQGSVRESTKQRALLRGLSLASASEQSTRGDAFQKERQEVTSSRHVSVRKRLLLAVKVLDQKVINLGGRLDQTLGRSLAVMNLRSENMDSS